jgi:hypothetical protein
LLLLSVVIKSNSCGRASHCQSNPPEDESPSVLIRFPVCVSSVRSDQIPVVLSYLGT